MDPVTAALILGGGSMALSAFGGNDTEDPKRMEPFPGYNQKLDSLLAQAQQKVYDGPKTSGIDFSLNKSPLLNASYANVLGKVNNPSDYPKYSKEVSDALYKAQKEKVAQSYADENTRQRNVYNRLGLASSTPGLQAEQDLGRKQAADENLLAASQADTDYRRQLEAYGMGEDQNLKYLSLGSVLGQQDLDAQKYTQASEYNDIARAEDQIRQYMQTASGILGGAGGGGSYFPQETPSTATQIGMAGQDIASLMLMYSMLGKKG